MTVYYELKALRAKNNINQKKMADVLNITVSTYNRKENGLRSFLIEEAREIANFFNKGIDEIFLPPKLPR